MSRALFGRNVRFRLEVSQKLFFCRGLSVGSVFFWRSHAAWESIFAKVALKALARGHFYFGGESSFFREINVILSFSVVFVVFCCSRLRPNAKSEKMEF